MEVEYNPQLGYRRTVFPESYEFLTQIVTCEADRDSLHIVARTQKQTEVKICLSFLSDTAFRFQMFPDGGQRHPKNQIFDFDRLSTALFSEEEDYYEYGMPLLKVRFRKAFWEMSVCRGNRLLTKEQIFDTNVDNRWKMLPLGFVRDEKGACTAVFENMYLYSDEAFFGFGEKFTGLNKRGQLLHCWQKDALSTNTEDSYKGHPFFLSSRGYAILWNTFTRSCFDMGFTSQVSYQLSSEDGYLDYCLYANGHEALDYQNLLQQYVTSTGPIPEIPRWALGFWLSKCSYQTREEVEGVVKKAREFKLPLDVIHIDGWQKPAYAGLWEWDTERFPDPEEMLLFLKAHHVHLSLWNYPYLEKSSPAFDEIREKGFFVRNAAGEPACFYAMADAQEVSACFDFTNPEMVAWYKERLKKIINMGVDVIKTDFSEAVPEDAVYFDGSSGIEGHNKLTYLYARTVYETMKECKGDKAAPLIWGRSGFAGSHRIPAAWAGDSSSALNNHSAILRGGLSLSMSGVPFWGFDLGGFYSTDASGNECLPTEEEYLRSVQLGLSMPLSRAHGKTPREPWMYSENVLKNVRKYDEIRHSLGPYLCAMMYRSHLECVPMLRTLAFMYPGDPVAETVELEYMLGDALLVAPPFDRERYRIYLPEGKWLDCLQGAVLDGGQFITVEPSLFQLPVFQRQNTILPRMGSLPVRGKGLFCTDKPGLMSADFSEKEREGLQYMPDEFGALQVDLFYESPFETEYFHAGADGRWEKQSFRAFEKPGDPNLWIETDMQVSEINLRGRHGFQGIILNGILCTK